MIARVEGPGNDVVDAPVFDGHIKLRGMVTHTPRQERQVVRGSRHGNYRRGEGKCGFGYREKNTVASRVHPTEIRFGEKSRDVQ